MSITCTSVTTNPAKIKADLLAVPIFKERVLGPGVGALDAALAGLLVSFMEEVGFEGKVGEVLTVPLPKVPARGAGPALAAKAVLLVGVGDQDKVTLDALRRSSAAAVKCGSKVKHIATTLLDAAPPDADRGAAAQAIAEGAVLGAYQFLEYKSDPKPSKLTTVTVLGKGGTNVAKGIQHGVAIAEAACWARDCVNQPAGVLYPETFAKEASKLAKANGLKVKVLSEAEILSRGLGGVAGVGQGAEHAPRLVQLRYEPSNPRATVALVGKGVTFDSGGLSLKPPEGMETMKTDMSGAAAVIAAMSVLSRVGVKVRVIGFIPMVENMPSGKAIRPGDVLKIRNGKTVEVLNTDAEGRLILADGLSLAVEAKPDAIIDLATLTGACMVALGVKIAGLMGNQDRWIDQVRSAADRAGESVWPLPLPAEYRSDLDSEIADLKNITGGRYGGTLTAGLFLQEFVGEVPWAHLDIAGPARSGSNDGYITKGGTGFGVRVLVELLRSFEKM